MEITHLSHGKVKDTTVSVAHTGATITSWRVEGVENIFVSSKAVLDGTKAIRGGIPGEKYIHWKYFDVVIDHDYLQFASLSLDPGSLEPSTDLPGTLITGRSQEPLMLILVQETFQ